MARQTLTLSVLVLLLVGSTLAVALPEPPFPSDPLPGPATDDPAVVGKWLAPFEGHVPAISMVLLDDGRVLYWGGVEAGEHDQVFFFDAPHVADIGILSPPYTAGSATQLAPPEGMGDLFCAGQTILPDGRVLIAGGSEWKNLLEEGTAFVDGERDAWLYVPATSSWERAPDMGVQRWYPTVMTLSSGRALAASGIEHLPQPQTLNTLLEVYDGDWSGLEGADNLLPMYPRLFTVPSGPMKGDVFYSTVGTLYGPFGEHPAEATWSLEQALDLRTNKWTTLGPSVFGARQHAATVMLPLSPEDDYTARLLTFGGSIWRSVAATNLAEMTTLGRDGVAHTVVPPLHHPRWHVNGVLLPDGSVLAVGGGMWDNVYAHGQRSSEVLVAERFDPAAGAWEQLAPMSVGRTYHSTALLLPDGRVLAGGHVPLPVPWHDVRDNAPHQSQIAETRFEIFEPPYLHWGAERPVIAWAPASVSYGESFTVASPDAGRVVDALLVHPGATTHAWDANQRAVVLPVAATSGDNLTFVAPPDGNVATPGPWMLFLRTNVEGKGLLPSEAKFVKLEGANEPPLLSFSPSGQWLPGKFAVTAGARFLARALDYDGDAIAGYAWHVTDATGATVATSSKKDPVFRLPIGDYVVHGSATDARGSESAVESWEFMITPG